MQVKSHEGLVAGFNYETAVQSHTQGNGGETRATWIY